MTNLLLDEFFVVSNILEEFCNFALTSLFFGNFLKLSLNSEKFYGIYP